MIQTKEENNEELQNRCQRLSSERNDVRTELEDVNERYDELLKEHQEDSPKFGGALALRLLGHGPLPSTTPLLPTSSADVGQRLINWICGKESFLSGDRIMKRGQRGYPRPSARARTWRCGVDGKLVSNEKMSKPDAAMDDEAGQDWQGDQGRQIIVQIRFKRVALYRSQHQLRPT